MKLQKLTIKNLASIEEAVIDFENGPLSEDSLFLICGETGAGKTTLLDAICLALYNETPRMDRAVNERYKDLGQTFSSKKEEIAINDNRQLMRRNTGEAWAELQFMGSNEVPYTACWYVARAHRKTSGAIQDIKWSLENRRTHLQLTKKNEIKAEIHSAVGLTFEQFCRTTLLAQGDFTKFLQSKESEKSDILEKLTGTEIYSKIGAQLYATTKQKRLDYEEQNRKLEGINLLTEEEINTINEAIRSQTAEVKEHTKQKNRAIAKREWLKREGELLRTKEEQKKRTENKKEQLQSDDFCQKELLIKEWETTTDARNWLSNLKQQQQQQLKNTEQAERLQTEFARLSRGSNWLANHLNEQKSRLNRVEEYLQLHASLLPMFEQSQSIITQLKASLAAQARTDHYKLQTEELSRQQLAKAKEFEEKEKAFAQQLSQNQSLQNEVDCLNKQLEGMNLPALQEEKNKWGEVRESLLKAQNALALLTEKAATLSTAREHEKELNTQRNLRHARQTELQAEFNSCQEAYTEIRALYDKQKEAVEEWAKEARARLLVGDLCPVCGQEVKSICKDQHFQSILAPIKDSLTTKENAFREAEKAFNNNQTELKTYEKLLTNSHLSVQKAQTDYDKTGAGTQALCMQCGVSSLSETTGEVLEKQLEENKLKLEKSNQQLSEARTLNQQIIALQRKKDEFQKLVDATRQILNESDKNLNDLKNQIKNKQSLIAHEQEGIQTMLEEVASKILWEEWQTEWRHSPTSFIEHLSKDANHYQQAQEKKKETLSNLHLIDKEQEGIAATYQNICTAFPNWPHSQAEGAQEIKNLGAAWSNLSAQASALKQNALWTNQNIDDLKTRLIDFQSANPTLNEERIAALIGYSKEQIETLRRQLQTLKEEEVAARSAFALTEKQLNEHIDTKPEMEKSDSAEALEAEIVLTDERITAANQAIGQQKLRLEENERNAIRIKDEKERASKLHETYMKWYRLCHHFGDEQGKNFRNIAQSFVLKELLYGANFYLQRLTNRYELECQAGSLTILLRDFYQGGAPRPASTLSGGEGFLVSLSLALGLSSLSRESLSVETLFIDEGFGTLSSDYLNTVMDTLEKLHQMGGKKVGIISHVEGLKERIKTQIQVQRMDNSRSEIKTIRTI